MADWDTSSVTTYVGDRLKADREDINRLERHLKALMEYLQVKVVEEKEKVIPAKVRVVRDEPF